MGTKLCLLALVLLTGHGFAQNVIHGRVVAVTDGDSIRVLTANQQLLVVHVAFVDAAERGQPFGNRLVTW
jgi:endonuclease YncB( thermonuclease family)